MNAVAPPAQRKTRGCAGRPSQKWKCAGQETQTPCISHVTCGTCKGGSRSAPRIAVFRRESVFQDRQPLLSAVTAPGRNTRLVPCLPGKTVWYRLSQAATPLHAFGQSGRAFHGASELSMRALRKAGIRNFLGRVIGRRQEQKMKSGRGSFRYPLSRHDPL